MKRRLVIAITTVIMLLGMAGSSMASSSPTPTSSSPTPTSSSVAPSPTKSAPSSNAATVQAWNVVCANGGNGKCMARKACGTGYTTAIVAWYNDYDGCEGAGYIQLYQMCNQGHVSSSGECPFTPGSGFNAEFNGDQIVAVLFTNPGNTANYGCLAAGASGGFDAALNACPNVAGNNGSIGSIFVSTPGGYLISRYASDAWFNNYGTTVNEGACSDGVYGDYIIYPQAQAGYCQWG